MTAGTLAAAGAFAFAAAAVYAFVGQRLGRRLVSPQAQRAATMFSVWWFGLAGTTAMAGVRDLLGSAGVLSLAPYLAITYLNVLIICIALGGLLHYLVFLFTGRDVLVPLVVFYAAYYAALVAYITFSSPTGVVVHRWNVQLEYATPITGPLFAAILVLLVAPQIVGALAYFTLYWRVKEPTQRYRIVLVSWSIILWFGSALAAAGTGAGQSDEWQLASRSIGLVAAGAILLAYYPPAFARRRWGLVSVKEEQTAASAVGG